MDTRSKLIALPLAASILLAGAGAAQAGSKYGDPRVGGWKVESGFGDVTGGSMSLSGKRKVTKLVALPNPAESPGCGQRIELVGKPNLKSYKQFSERWALAGVKGRLLVPKATGLKVDGKSVRGKVELIWNSPKLAEGQFRHGTCVLNFELRPK